jgi:SAM-dependent methyltransferase
MIDDKTLARIHRLTAEFSAGVTQENAVNNDAARQHEAFLDSCRTAVEYYENGVSPAHFDYAIFVARFGERKLRVLDIGVGQGESSVFLAVRGHSVVAVEPSIGYCRLIAAAAEKFELDVTPILTVGEEIDRIGENVFDVVAFNASLHHCDDPARALRNAFHVLKSGGVIFLCSELQLHPWVRKGHWYERLKTHPVEMGHYGGNEHAYYSWEYHKMLRDAGFIGVTIEPLALALDPLRHIEIGITGRVQGKRIWNEWKTLSRTIWYIFAAKIIRFRSVFNILCGASLLPAQFHAIKP